MGDIEKKQFDVEFMPDGQSIIVPSGSTIMDAAQNAGVYLNSICGGEGLCGKCRVIVRDGLVNMKPNSFLDRNEIQNGYVIACLAEVLSDIHVEVPEETRLEGIPKFDAEDARRFGLSEKGKMLYPHDPLCRKIYLELPMPSIKDNLSDLDRIEREITRTQSFPVMNTSLKNLQSLAPLLRTADFKVTVALADRGQIVEMIRFEAGNTSDSNYGIAVDIGTTTVVADIINLNDGKICGTTASYNSQIKYGEDVISRIVYSQENEDGLRDLNRTIVKELNNLTDALIKQCNIPLRDVNYMVCAGNTTMIHILLGLPPASIRKEPYIPVAGKPPVIRASDIGIKIGRGGLLNCLPGVGAYVGTDITSAVLASGMAHEETVSVLIDVGTNGEIVLGNREWLICCSASAGPAFEGAGTRCGMRATSGAIEKVCIRDNGKLELEIIGGKNQKPKGICGSGYIDLVSELFSAGIIDRKGRFRNENHLSHLWEGEDGMEYILIEKEKSALGKDIVITEADIATFIRTKGAIFTAEEALLRKVKFSWSDVERVYISGGFGNFLDIRRSIIIGLLPDIPEEKFHFIGNGSIQGAQMCLVSRAALKEAVRIANSMTYYDLSTDPWFMNEYTSSLFLPHTDLEKFPTVLSPEVC